MDGTLVVMVTIITHRLISSSYSDVAKQRQSKVFPKRSGLTVANVILWTQTTVSSWKLGCFVCASLALSDAVFVSDLGELLHLPWTAVVLLPDITQNSSRANFQSSEQNWVTAFCLPGQRSHDMHELGVALLTGFGLLTKPLFLIVPATV